MLGASRCEPDWLQQDSTGALGWQLSPGTAPAPALLWQRGLHHHRAAVTHPGTGTPAPGCPSPLASSWHAGFGLGRGFPGSVPPHNYGGDKRQGALLPGDGRSPAPRARACSLIKPYRGSGAGGEGGANLVLTQ